MSSFEYSRADSLENARNLLQRSGSVPLGGGTDLLVAIREGIIAPEALIDLRGVQGAAEIAWLSESKAPDPQAAVRIGAATRVAEIAADPGIREQFPALAQACEAVGTPALRNMGTLGGNLCQRPRCWYFRAGVSCSKNGGDDCPAVPGENQYHAILGGGPCHVVHPSDPAVALVALEASVHVTGPGGARAVAIEKFFVLPRERMDAETVLGAGEFVTHVEIPAHSSGGRQRYEKLMQRGAWDFALASLAVVKRRDAAVRLVLGGVAPVPWRVNSSVEEDVASGGVSEDDVETLAERALYDAQPLAKNGYKVALAKTLIRRGIEFVTH